MAQCLENPLCGHHIYEPAARFVMSRNRSPLLLQKTLAEIN